MPNVPEFRIIRRDSQPERIKTIGNIASYQVDGWQGIYVDQNIIRLLPISAWCSGIDASGRRIGDSPDDNTFTVYGLVIVGNHLEVCDTHLNFVAYVNNAPRNVILELVEEWRGTDEDTNAN